MIGRSGHPQKYALFQSIDDRRSRSEKMIAIMILRSEIEIAIAIFFSWQLGSALHSDPDPQFLAKTFFGSFFMIGIGDYFHLRDRDQDRDRKISEDRDRNPIFFSRSVNTLEFTQSIKLSTCLQGSFPQILNIKIPDSNRSNPKIFLKSLICI